MKYNICQNTYFSLLQLSDLINFLAVAFFVVVGVGIYYHANLWPDDQSMWSGDWTDWRIWTIVYYPYWQLYAEMNLGILEGITYIPVKTKTVNLCSYIINHCFLLLNTAVQHYCWQNTTKNLLYKRLHSINN